MGPAKGYPLKRVIHLSSIHLDRSDCTLTILLIAYITTCHCTFTY